MAITEYWTSNHGVRIQYLENSSRGGGLPLLCIPGDGHEVWQADYPRFLGSLRTFLLRLANGPS
ncbi:MAG: hypothetical protein ACM3XM_20395 [Mycobacterium leprae]